jgi:hypothetical protein
VAHVEIDRAEVRRAAAQVGAAADTVDGVTHHEAASSLATAMPGSASAAAARGLSAAWSTAADAWVAEARAQEQRMTASVAAVVATDQQSAQQLSRMASRLGPVPQ